MDRRNFLKGLSAIVLSSSLYSFDSFGKQNPMYNTLDDQVRILDDNEHFKIILYSEGFRVGDAILVELEPKNIELDFMHISTKLKIPEDYGKEAIENSFTSNSFGFNKKIYSIIGSDFLCPEQTIDLRFKMMGGLIDTKIVQSYFLDLKSRDLETRYLPPAPKPPPNGTSEENAYVANKRYMERVVLPRLWPIDTYSSSMIEGYISPRPICDSSRFGSPRFNYSRGKKGRINYDKSKATPRHPHRGVDCEGHYNDKIYAAMSGKVKFSERNLLGLGSLVVLDHGLGLYTMYAHMNKNKMALVGQEVAKGDVIGHVGKTGIAYGYHLHFQSKLHGMNIDPTSLSILNKVFHE